MQRCLLARCKARALHEQHAVRRAPHHQSRDAPQHEAQESVVPLHAEDVAALHCQAATLSFAGSTTGDGRPTCQDRYR